ncbi:MAG TPA: lytic transglycosylase domain-containing protein [Holophagaceae bacterium]|nr:lytic transglycosylase domain-containing protein [Holophagaceae bacterium]
MRRHARNLALAAATLPLVAGHPHTSRKGSQKTYIYTYLDAKGQLIINNLPPSYMQGRGLRLQKVSVGMVKLAITRTEMAKVIRSPEMLAMVDEIAAANGVDTYLARAIIQAESAFNYRARSHVGALGLMQLMPSTAERFGVLDPFDPRQNIMGGCKYLRWLTDYFKGDLSKVVAAYNAGEGAVQRYNGVPPFKETRAYVPKVLDLYQRKAVQPDQKDAGAMALLNKGRGGFQVDGKELPADQKPFIAGNTRIYQWMDGSGRLKVSDSPPPKGTPGVKVFGGTD